MIYVYTYTHREAAWSSPNGSASCVESSISLRSASKHIELI